MKKIVHFTNNDFDGAGRAVVRLHNALKRSGNTSIMLTHQSKHAEHDGTIIELGLSNGLRQALKDKKSFKAALRHPKKLMREIILYFKRSLYRSLLKPKELFNFDFSTLNIQDIKEYLRDTDAIIFHSTQDFTRMHYISTLWKMTGAKVLICPRDMEPLTGGCHFPHTCTNYQNTCLNCPQVSEVVQKIPFLAPATLLKRKELVLSKVPITVIATNSFVYHRLKKSRVFKDKSIKTIYMGIEKEKISKVSQSQAKAILGLGQNKKVILFGCFNFSDPRKGAHLLHQSLAEAIKLKPDHHMQLVTFGQKNNFTFNDLDIPWKHLGFISNPQHMALVYRASSVLVNPSLDDLGPTILQEAFVNSISLISFDMGLAQDFIINGQNGYIIDNFNTKEMAVRIIEVLEKNFNIDKYSHPTLLERQKQCYEDQEALNYLKIITSTSV